MIATDTQAPSTHPLARILARAEAGLAQKRLLAVERLRIAQRDWQSIQNVQQSVMRTKTEHAICLGCGPSARIVDMLYVVAVDSRGRPRNFGPKPDLHDLLTADGKVITRPMRQMTYQRKQLLRRAPGATRGLNQRAARARLRELEQLIFRESEFVV